MSFMGLASDYKKEDPNAKLLEKWSGEIAECFRQVNGRFNELNQKIDYEMSNLHERIERESQFLMDKMQKVHQETKEMISNLGQEITEEIQQTRNLLMERLQDLADRIEEEGKKTRTLILSDPITTKYDEYRRKVSKIVHAVDLYTETLLTNASNLNLRKLKGSCGIETSILSVPEDALEWYYSVIVLEKRKNKNLLHILVKELEHDTMSLLNVTAILKMDIANAFHYTTICDSFADKSRARHFLFSQSTLCRSGMQMYDTSEQ